MKLSIMTMAKRRFCVTTDGKDDSINLLETMIRKEPVMGATIYDNNGRPFMSWDCQSGYPVQVNP